MTTRLALLTLPVTLILLAACSSEPPPPSATLIGAVLAGDLPKADATLDASAAPNAIDLRSDDVTPLLPASLNRDVRSVTLLIEAGAAVDARTRDGGTALQFARGNDLLVQLPRHSGAEA